MVALVRHLSTVSKDRFRVLVVGGGTAGISASHQIYDRFKRAGKKLADGDVALLDDAEFHHYQPGWTLVGAGLGDKLAYRRKLSSLVPPHISLIPERASSFSPDTNSVTTSSGRSIGYDFLVVAAGIQINWGGIKGLSEALGDPNSGVTSIYSYETCDKTWKEIEGIRNGNAIFTQPAGVIKCAGAPQKIMWMAWDRFRRTSRLDTIKLEFLTGMPSMFSVKKYSDALNELRIQRGVHGAFQHNLVSINTSNRTAQFQTPTDGIVEREYTLLHAVPPMGPPSFIQSSPLADGAGWVDVDPASLQHKKYKNVFSLGDCSSLPTSKTAAAITAQAPVLTENLFDLAEKGEVQKDKAVYDGYTSCPLLTSYGKLMLAEFKYGLEPKESFAGYVGDQVTPRRLFYWFKTSLFPHAYYEYMVKGKWFGPHGMRRPL